MNRLLAIIILLISAAGANVALADTRTPLWETVEVHDEVPGSVNDPIEVETRDKKIYITTTRPVEVSVYTILGQLITKRKIAPGTVRLTLGTRGVYILRTETTTRRINL